MPPAPHRPGERAAPRGPRHRPGDRAALEAELSEEELEILAEMCRSGNVPVSAWAEVAWIARPWQMLAAARLAERIRGEEGCAIEVAARTAAQRLGLSAETLKCRARRGRRKARRKLCIMHSGDASGAA